jgi:hypothetical protein
MSPDNRTIDNSPTLRVVRIAALVVILMLLALWLAGVPLFIRGITADLDSVLRAIFVEGAWTPSAVRDAADGLGISPVAIAWVWLGIEVVGVSSFGIGGLVLFWRKPDWFGTYLGVAFVLISTNISGPITGMVSEAVPSLAPLLGYDGLLASLAFLAFASLLYVFPTGTFVPAWTRWFAPAGIVLIVLYDYAFRDLLGIAETNISSADILLFLGYFAIGLCCQVFRYWHVSDIVAREQSKWAILTFVLFLLTIIVSWMLFPNAMSYTAPPTPLDLVGFIVTLVILSASTTLLIAALAVAILRYRLWDIDVIIRRTLVYAFLTAVLALTYFGLVVVLQGLFRVLTGQDSSIAIVISTLTIAALFTPVRQRVQRLIDRRFYRSRYDAQRALETFNAQMRDEVDMDRLHNALVNIVHETIQPTHVALWLNEGE